MFIICLLISACLYLLYRLHFTPFHLPLFMLSTKWPMGSYTSLPPARVFYNMYRICAIVSVPVLIHIFKEYFIPHFFVMFRALQIVIISAYLAPSWCRNLLAREAEWSESSSWWPGNPILLVAGAPLIFPVTFHREVYVVYSQDEKMLTVILQGARALHHLHGRDWQYRLL